MLQSMTILVLSLIHIVGTTVVDDELELKMSFLLYPNIFYLEYTKFWTTFTFFTFRKFNMETEGFHSEYG